MAGMVTAAVSGVIKKGIFVIKLKSGYRSVSLHGLRTDLLPLSHTSPTSLSAVVRLNQPSAPGALSGELAVIRES